MMSSYEPPSLSVLLQNFSSVWLEDDAVQGGIRYNCVQPIDSCYTYLPNKSIAWRIGANEGGKGGGVFGFELFYRSNVFMVGV